MVLAATLWGFGGVTGVLLSEHAGLHPLSIAMWRMLVAGLALVAYLALRGALRVPRGAARRRVLLTGALTALFEALFFSGIMLASVGLSTLIGIGSAPVFVAVHDWATTRRRPETATLAALALALIGLTLLLGGSLDTGEHGLLGAAIALGAGAAFAALTVVNRAEVPGLGPVPHTAWAFTAGGLMLIPVAAVPGLGMADDAYGWLLTLGMGVVVTALAYVAYLTGLRTVPPFVATIVTLLEPLVAALLAALVLTERLGWGGLVGAAALATAVVLLRPQRDASEAVR